MIIYNKRSQAFTHMYEMCKDVISDNKNELVGVGTVKLNFDLLKNKYPGTKFISYNFEQLFDKQRFLKPGGELMNWLMNADELWDYDLYNIQYCEKVLGRCAKYKPLVYTESLKIINNNPDPEIDVLFYGLDLPIRRHMYNELIQELPHLNIKFFMPRLASEYATQEQLNSMIGNSKIVLNLLSVADIQPQSRIFYNLINGKCVVSQKCKTNIYNDLIVESNDLVKDIDYLISSGGWKQYASNASNGFKQLSNSELIQYWK